MTFYLRSYERIFLEISELGRKSESKAVKQEIQERREKSEQGWIMFHFNNENPCGLDADIFEPSLESGSCLS